MIVNEPFVAEVLGKKIDSNVIARSAMKLISKMCWKRDRKKPTTVSSVRVGKGFPIKGKIRFTRDADDKRFEIVLDHKNLRWNVAEVM